MAQNYKIRLRRWNGTDFDILCLSSENILMNSGQNIETVINSKPSINDNTSTSTNVWSAQKTSNQINNIKEKLANITLSSSWSGSGPYTQTVTISNETITSKTKVDVQPDTTVIQSMMNNGIYGLYIGNNNGILTAYCVGGYFSDSISIQVSLSEVQ